MSVFAACKEAIAQVRALGIVTTNRLVDLHRHGVPLVKTPAGGLHYPPVMSRDAMREAGARLHAVGERLDAMRAGRGYGPDVAENVALLDDIARSVAIHKLGNCGELSAFVFSQLRRKHLRCKVAMVEWMDGNHNFVVAGLPNSFVPRRFNYDPSSAPVEWGREAVWCDAWSGNCFDAAKEAPWGMYSRQILRKTAPHITTDGGRRTTWFKVIALASCVAG